MLDALLDTGRGMGGCGTKGCGPGCWEAIEQEPERFLYKVSAWGFGMRAFGMSFRHGRMSFRHELYELSVYEISGELTA